MKKNLSAYNWVIEYNLKGVKAFFSDAPDYPTAYKSFWAMVKEGQLWKKQSDPIHIINNWRVENGALVPHNLNQYSDAELGIMNEPFILTGQKAHVKGY